MSPRSISLPPSRSTRFSGRRTNLALLVALGLAFATGLTAQALGTPRVGGWVALAHGVAGLSVLLLAPWKTRVSRRGLSRRNKGRAVSLLMAFMAVVVLATGFVHSVGIPARIGSVTVLWVHVATALGIIPLAIWHVVAHKTTPRWVDMSRRNLLRLSGLASASGVLWWAGDRIIALAGLPGAGRRFSGSHEVSSFAPGGMPVTSWLDDRTPSIEPSSWSLEILDHAGLRSFSLADLAGMEAETIDADLDCTSGWYSRQLWKGIPLDRIIDPDGARSVGVRSVTGYARRLPVADLSRLWLATEVGDRPLSPGHGFPVRLVAPDRRGFWWVKWVVRVETSPVPWWVQSPFPLT